MRETLHQPHGPDPITSRLLRAIGIQAEPIFMAHASLGLVHKALLPESRTAFGHLGGILPCQQNFWGLKASRTHSFEHTPLPAYRLFHFLLHSHPTVPTCESSVNAFFLFSKCISTSYLLYTNLNVTLCLPLIPHIPVHC